MGNDCQEPGIIGEGSLRLAIIGNDRNIYSLYLEGNENNINNIRQVSHLLGINFISAKNMLNEQSTEIFSGNIYKLFSLLNELNELDFQYRIFPAFPYDKTLIKGYQFAV